MPTYAAGDYEPMIGFTATVKSDDTFDGVAGAAYTNPLEITVPKRTWGKFESTKLVQTDYARKFKPTLLDNGELKISGFFSKAEHTRVVGLSGNGGTSKPPNQTWTISTPDPDGATATLTGQSISFTGWVSEVGEIKFEKDKEVMFEFSITVTGPITYGNAANGTMAP